MMDAHWFASCDSQNSQTPARSLEFSDTAAIPLDAVAIQRLPFTDPGAVDRLLVSSRGRHAAVLMKTGRVLLWSA
jgi:hypothetical protein